MIVKKDPICGMDVNPEKAKEKGLDINGEQFFCSEQCLNKFKGKKENHFTEILLSLSLIVVAVIVYLIGHMLPFMGIVFLLLSILKLIDLKGFAIMFSQYDLIASKTKIYAYCYPFIELVLGFMFLLQFQIVYAAGFTFLIMGISSVGVAKNIFSKTKLKCACLGAKINLPLTRFTLVEDLLMCLMGLMILLGF